MKQWREFYPYVLPDVLTCPEPTMVIALVHAAREFFETTRAWDVVLDPVLTEAGVAQYDFSRASADEVVKVLGATVDSQALSILALNDLPSGWQVNGGARGIFTTDRRTFHVLPTPQATSSISIRAAMKPALNSKGLPDEMFAQYAYEIATGAKAILMMSPKKEYTELALGREHRDSFAASMASVARKVEKSFSRVPRRTVAHYF